MKTLAAVAALLGCASVVEAQVDEALLTKRWKTDNFWAETYDRPYYTGTGHFEGSQEDFQMFHWVSVGRIKFDSETLDPSVWLGYKMNSISMTTDREFLNHAYGDVALGGAGQLGSLGGGWSLSAGTAIGTANDGRWDNSEALYFTGTVDFAYRKADGLPLHVGLGYDGNRTVYNGVPIPHFLMEIAPDPTLTLLIGFPKAEVVWRPTSWLILSAEWQLSSQSSARVDVDIGAGMTIFADVVRRIDAFHLRDVIGCSWKCTRRRWASAGCPRGWISACPREPRSASAISAGRTSWTARRATRSTACRSSRSRSPGSTGPRRSPRA